MILSVITIGLVIGIILLLYIIACMFYLKTNNNWIFIISSILSAVGIIVFIVLCVITSATVISNESIIVNSYDIRAVSSVNSLSGDIHGGVFVISGYISGNSVFNCYIKENDQTYSLRTLPAEKTKIIISDDTPRLEIFEVTPKCQWLIFELYKDSWVEYKLYIPENGLTTDIYLS